MGDFQRIVEGMRFRRLTSLEAALLKASEGGAVYQDLISVYLQNSNPDRSITLTDILYDKWIGFVPEWIEELGNPGELVVYLLTDEGREALRRYDEEQDG